MHTFYFLTTFLLTTAAFATTINPSTLGRHSPLALALPRLPKHWGSDSDWEYDYDDDFDDNWKENLNGLGDKKINIIDAIEFTNARSVEECNPFIWLLVLQMICGRD